MNKKRLAEHLEKLATFKEVAELKSIRKASSRLGITQPAVSRTIKVLEDVLECRLMVRESRGIRLTSDGSRLYEYANIIAKTIESFDASSEIGGFGSRPFRVATYDNIACGVLSDIGKELIGDFPHLQISVGGPNSRILGELIAEKFDCALIAQPRILAGLEYKKLFAERYGLFVSRRAFLKRRLNKKDLRSGDLKEFKIIAMPDAIAGVNKNIDRLLWETGLTSVITVDSYQVAMQLVRDGHGMGIMPFSSAWREIRDKNLKELLVKDIPRGSLGHHDITLCWHSKESHPGVLKFEKLMTKYFSQVLV